MIRLNLEAARPRWVEIAPGVRLHVLPLTTDVMVAAEAEVDIAPDVDVASEADVAAAMQGDEAAITRLAEQHRARKSGARDLAVMRAYARRIIVGWEGVTGPDDQPAPVTPEYVDAFLGSPRLLTLFRYHVVAPAMGLVTEKNASSPSPATSSAGATTTAGDAASAAPPARRM